MYACIMYISDPDFSCGQAIGSTRGSTRGHRGPKNHPEYCFMNDSSPSVHGGAVEVELGGGGADQVQHLVIIMMIMKVSIMITI